MKTITRTMFNGTTAQLAARIADFNAAKEAHARTVGVPAPREEDWLEELARTGELFEVEPAPQAPPPPSPEEAAAIELAAKRQAALRALEDVRLAAAIADPTAPQEVKDYAALLAARSIPT